MTRDFRRNRRAGLAWALSAIAVGCGGPAAAPAPEPPPQQVALQQVGEMYRAFGDQHSRPPRGEADLATYAPAFSHGSMALVNKQVEVLWNCRIAPGSDAVLAYEVGVPGAGGMVLLLDGETVRPMTPEQFRAAPRADGK